MADVCIVTKTWRYGVAWFVHSLVQALVDLDVSVCLIAPLSEPESREVQSRRLRRSLIPRELVAPVNVIGRVTASMRRITTGLAAAIAERRRTRTFLVTIPDPLIFSLPMFLMLRLSGARILYVVHDAIPHAWRLPTWLRWLEKGAHGLSYRAATELIIHTAALRQPLEQEFGISPGKIIVIPQGPHGVGELAPPPGKGRLLLFGTLRSNKSVLEVIEGVSLARRSDPSLQLVIAGEPHPSEPEYWRRCQAAIAQDPAGFDLRERFVAEEELPDLITLVDAFVLAYDRFNSQSGVGALAALNGRPIICTPAGGLRDLIEQGLSHQLIGQPVTAESVARAIRAFRARPFPEWRAEAAASTARFNDELSWPAVGAAFAERIRGVGH